MPQQGWIFRALIASPSDCGEEREAVPRIVAEWNAAHSLQTAAIIEPVMWETHSHPEVGDRPQAIINKQLVERCDILIGTFWTRLGTHTGKAESGTAEEIEETRLAGKKVLIYFSSKPAVPTDIDPEQFKALQEYKATLKDKALYSGYESLQQLRDSLRSHLAATMYELLAMVGGPLPLPAPAEVQDPMDDLRKFLTSYEKFLRRFEFEWATERDSDPHGTDEGKQIMAAALSGIGTIRSQIANGLNDVRDLLENVARLLRQLDRHMLFMDGGKSFSEFWANGNYIISELQKVPDMIHKAIASENEQETGDTPPANPDRHDTSV